MVKVGLYLTKNNRGIYHSIFSAARHGLEKAGIKFSIEPKHCDLAITCSDTPSKISGIYNQQKKNGGYFMPIVLGDFMHKEFITLHNREKYRNGQTKLGTPLFFNFYGPDYYSHYYNSPMSSHRFFTRFDLPISDISFDESKKNILITEQVRPEGYNGGINSREQWFDWLENIYFEIKDVFGDQYDIVLRRHPNRKVWPEGSEDLTNKIPDDIIISEGKTVEEDLDDCYILATVSSRVYLKAIAKGVPVVLYNKNSAAYNITYRNFTDIVLKKPQDYIQWWYDIAWSNWSIGELFDGSYFKYMKDNLLYERTQNICDGSTD